MEFSKEQQLAFDKYIAGKNPKGIQSNPPLS